MNKCLILFRSLTAAQYVAKLLGKEGISAAIVRTPKNLATEGCGYAIKLNSNFLESAYNILMNSGARFTKIYCSREDGSYEVVSQ